MCSQGDPEVAFLLADFYYDREDGEYLDNQTEAFRAYNCMDYPRDCDRRGAGGRRGAARRRGARRSRRTGAGPDPCEVWPYPPTGVREPIAADGAAPIVVVGTHERPGDAVRVGGVARGPARVREC